MLYPGSARELLNSTPIDAAIVDTLGNQLAGFDPSRPDTAVSATITVNNTAGGTVLLAANAARRKFLIWNDSGAKIFIGYEAVLSASDFAYEVPNNGFYESDINDYTGEIRAFRTSGSGSVRITEITKA